MGRVTGLPEGEGRADTFYAAVGGEETFRKLVDAFYAGVAADPILRPIYPEDDLGPAAERLRMRHAPFPIGDAQRDAWLSHMRDALDVVDLAPAHRQVLWDYLVAAADSMRNLAG